LELAEVLELATFRTSSFWNHRNHRAAAFGDWMGFTPSLG